jgi:hypothetical protein
LRRWLDAKNLPILIQLPKREFERLREAWGLLGLHGD